MPASPDGSSDEAAEAAAQDPFELVAATAHDMRTPLSAIAQALDLLGSGRAGSLTPTQAHFVALGRRNVENLLGMTVSMQQAARARAGMMLARFVPHDVADVTGFVAEALELLARSRGITLSLSVAPDCPLAWGDPDLVRRLVFNLAGNALKFTPAGGAVRIEAAAEGGDIALRVTDSGPGIPPGEAARIFSRYYQCEGSKDAAGGVGLGLAIVREIVEAHAGEVAVANNIGAPGCTFSVVLPGLGTGRSARAQFRQLALQGRTPARLLCMSVPADALGCVARRMQDGFATDGLGIVDLGAGTLGVHAWSEFPEGVLHACVRDVLLELAPAALPTLRWRDVREDGTLRPEPLENPAERGDARAATTGDEVLEPAGVR